MTRLTPEQVAEIRDKRSRARCSYFDIDDLLSHVEALEERDRIVSEALDNATAAGADMAAAISRLESDLTACRREKAMVDAVAKFLLGEVPLDGFWFGERPAGKPQFWWRTHLRAALSAQGQPAWNPDDGNMHPKADPSKYDAGQHRLNGGPYCYFEKHNGKYCGAAKRWPGHGVYHPFVAEPGALSAQAGKGECGYMGNINGPGCDPDVP